MYNEKDKYCTPSPNPTLILIKSTNKIIQSYINKPPCKILTNCCEIVLQNSNDNFFIMLSVVYVIKYLQMFKIIGK